MPRRIHLLALYHAQHGNISEARKYWSALVKNPDTPSSWKAEAEKWLAKQEANKQ